MTVRVTQDNLKAVLANIVVLGQKHVLIGIPDTKDGRDDGPIGNAQLGHIHENGSPANNIPARPFLKPGVEDGSEQAAAVLKKSAKASFNDPAAIEKGLVSAGLICQASVKARIASQEGFAPLKPATIAARKRKGAKGDKALIRTGQLLNSVSFVVREKK